jgi:hypothetical protein
LWHSSLNSMGVWEKTVVACLKLDFGSCLDDVSKVTRNLIKCSRSPTRYETDISSMRVGSSDRFSLDPVCRQTCIGSSFLAASRCRAVSFSALACSCWKWKFLWLKTWGQIGDQQESRRYCHVAVRWGRDVSCSSLTGLLVISKRTNRFLFTLAADCSMSVTRNSVHDDFLCLGWVVIWYLYTLTG